MATGRIFVAALTVLLISGTLLYFGSVHASELDEGNLDDGNFLANDAQIEDSSDSHVNVESENCCRQKASDKKPYIFISTLDGRISAIDASSDKGRLIWNLQTDVEPLLSSSLSSIPFYANNAQFRLIPSLDGHLYMFNDAKLQKVPFNVDALLSGSLKLGADVLSGGKIIQTHFVDFESGQVHQTCGASGCEHFDDSSKSQFRKLIIKRITQTVRAVDPNSGAERWNFTVGEHEMILDDSDSGSTCICLDENEQFTLDYFKGDHVHSHAEPLKGTPSDLLDIDLRIVPPQGIVMAYDKNNPSTLLWETKLDSPIVQLWILSPNGQLIERSIFEPSLVPAFSYYSIDGGKWTKSLPGHGTGHSESSIYIGTYSDQKYVIRSPEERKKMQEFKSYHTTDSDRVYLLGSAGLLQIEDQSSEDGHCGNDCPTCASEEVNSLILRDQYPRDMGWYLYKHKISPPRLSRLPPPATRKTKTTKQHAIASFLDSLPSWQFYVLVFSILGAIVVPTVLVARFYGRQLKELKELAAKCLPRKDAKVEPVCKLNDSQSPSPVTETTRLTKLSIDRMESKSSPELVGDFTGRSYGRYASDFEPLRQLGRGGFGIVLESRNKHDDQLYAVKRIAFALKHSAKERVRREVKALAQLDHPGIVRYFSAWFEEPPAYWQKKIDREMFMKCCREVGDELSFGQTSASEPWKLTKPSVNLDALKLEVGADGDALCSKDNSKEFSASTFGNWTDDGQISLNNNWQRPDDVSVEDDLKRPMLQKPFGQESVEIIFAHSTTNVIDTPEQERKQLFERNRNRKSSSSKPSSTKSEEDNSVNIEGNNEQKLVTESIGTAYLYIQMQLCRGTLKDWLLVNNSVEDRDRPLMLDWFDQLVCAMEYVHHLGLVHRDLKPSNIFFSTTGHLKIGDFGLATKTLPPNIPSDTEIGFDGSNAGGDNQKSLSLLDTMSPSRGTDRVGTQLYMSPEQEAGKKCTSKADIYALGLIFMELLIPFKTLMERVRVIQDARRNVFADDFELNYPQEHSLIKRLLNHDQELRPTCSEIRRTDLFKSCLSVRPLFDRNDQYQNHGRTISRDSGRYSASDLPTPEKI